jgi:hypothetical protein
VLQVISTVMVTLLRGYEAMSQSPQKVTFQETSRECKANFVTGCRYIFSFFKSKLDYTKTQHTQKTKEIRYYIKLTAEILN